MYRQHLEQVLLDEKSELAFVSSQSSELPRGREAPMKQWLSRCANYESTTKWPTAYDRLTDNAIHSAEYSPSESSLSASATEAHAAAVAAVAAAVRSSNAPEQGWNLARDRDRAGGSLTRNFQQPVVSATNSSASVENLQRSLYYRLILVFFFLCILICIGLLVFNNYSAVLSFVHPRRLLRELTVENEDHSHTTE